MSRIFTYFDSTPDVPLQGEIIRQWRDSWEHRGHECKILNPRTFVTHRLFPAFKAAMSGVDPLQRALLSRWIALDVVGGGWICHYDVMNFAPFPFHFPRMQKTTFYDKDLSIGYVSKSDAHRAVKKICEGERSEFLAFQNARFDLSQKHHAQFGTPGWRDAMTVHFSSESVRFHGDENRPVKHKVIDSCGKAL